MNRFLPCRYLFSLVLCWILGGILFLHAKVPSERQGRVSGIIRDAETNEPMEFVSVGVFNLIKPIGKITDEKGRFSLDLPAEKDLVLRISYTGYQSVNKKLKLKDGEILELEIYLHSSRTELEGVSVRADAIRKTAYMTINPLEVKNLPSVGGGVEALIKSLPGVSSNNELSSQYSVRGGNFDENLVYINDIEIYRPFLTRSGEQEGLSFINPDLVDAVQFSSGGFDAKYGDKLSSVLDIRYKKPQSFKGSFGIHFMGGNAHVEGISKNKKFTYLAGIRHKANQYVLKMLDKKGNYKPSFTDIQALFTYQFDPKNRLEFLGNFSYNRYRLVPSTQKTATGNADNAKIFTVAFEGQELDVFTTYFMAASWVHQPSKNLYHKLTYTFFNTIENENYDIQGAYRLQNLEIDPVSNTQTGGVVLGIGSYLDHARNYLNGLVTGLQYNGYAETPGVYWQWGAKYQYEDIIDKINEWRMEDSAGYLIPVHPEVPGEETVVVPPPTLTKVYQSDNTIISHRISAFGQANFNFNSGEVYSLNVGLRMSYWTFNREFLISPRINFSASPQWNFPVNFRLAIGHYAQAPFYKEMRDVYGNVHREVKAQKSIHNVFGTDFFFNMWKRPFKFSAEVYYKYLYDINPYEIDNIRIKYMASNGGRGYATGLDLRLNGEFVPGAQSWISVSLMKASENIVYTDADGNQCETGFVPRPTDRLFAINVYFQDYVTRHKNFKVYLNMVYATGLPSGDTERLKDPSLLSTRKTTLRLPDYKRVDLGMAYLLKGKNKKFKSSKNPLNYIDNIWIGLEFFNIFQMNNTISYTWVNAIDGNSYPIPNRLTPFQVNLKLNIDF